MNKHLGYGLLFIILLPVASLFGISIISSLPAALQMPVLLIPVFLIACFVIYTFATFVFYRKAVLRQQPCKPTLRDLIRVNAFIIILPTALLLLESVVVIADPSLLGIALKQYKDIQQQPFPMSEAMMIRSLTWMFAFLLVYAIALSIHIGYTFWLLKKNKPLFDFEAFGKEQ